jgi:ssDNA-binding Zn-finger/Zn-ribbon topoisomerase 1
MENPKCESLQCNATLLTATEIASGLCDKCIDLISKRHHFAVVCWHCGAPTLIDAKPVEAGEALIKDKYIMSKSCPKCDKDSDGLRLMTIRQGEKSDVVLGPGETLNPCDSGLEAGPKKALIHRDIKPTVDIELGASIIGEVTISNESAIKKAQNFLDNITLKDDNYDQHTDPS